MTTQPAFSKDVELVKLIVKCGFERTLESIHFLPDTKAPIKELFTAVYNGEVEAIQPLYTRICEFPTANISALTREPNILLRALLNVSINRETMPVVERLLSISPQPEPDLRSFLNDGRPGLSLQSDASPELWSLMIKYGWLDADRDSSALDLPLYMRILSNDGRCVEALTLMLSYGVNVNIGHLRMALKKSNIEVMDLLLKRFPRAELDDCRLLHEAIEWQDLDMACWLLDVGKMDINLIPTEGPRIQHEEMNPGGKAETNGTPLHDVV